MDAPDSAAGIAAEAAAGPPELTYEDIAGMIEHAVLAPEATEEDVRAACDLARSYRVAAIVVRPYDADVAVRWMAGSGVAVGSLVSYPNGIATTPVKLYEARDLLRRGVKEIDAVVGASKMIAREFIHLETEMQQIATSCRESDAILKITFHTDLLAEDLKSIACKIVKRAGAAYARTTSRSMDDIALFRRLCGERAKVAATAGTLDELKAAREAGAVRVTTTATAQILDAWKAEIAARAPSETPPAAIIKS